MAKRAVDNCDLERWRATPSLVVLRALAEHAKQDTSFVPIAAESTTRWHATVAGRDYELLLTGPKFFDTRAQKGGGGAVDLAMHLFSLDFKGAVSRLRSTL